MQPAALEVEVAAVMSNNKSLASVGSMVAIGRLSVFLGWGD
jgi:hypothetical protein